MKSFFTIATFILFSCASSQQNTSKISIPFEILSKGSHGGYTISKEIVIKNEQELRRVYTQINMIRKPGIPIPTIDFKKEMVIALFMGEKSTGGYAIFVDKINETKDNIEIVINYKKPAEMTTMVITQPFYFCKFNKVDKEIIFNKVE